MKPLHYETLIKPLRIVLTVELMNCITKYILIFV